MFKELGLCSFVEVSYLHEEVEEPSVQSLGQSVSCECSLLRVQSHRDGLCSSTPATVHHSTGQFTAQRLLLDAQQVGREGQNWDKVENRIRPSLGLV